MAVMRSSTSSRLTCSTDSLSLSPSLSRARAKRGTLPVDTRPPARRIARRGPGEEQAAWGVSERARGRRPRCRGRAERRAQSRCGPRYPGGKGGGGRYLAAARRSCGAPQETARCDGTRGSPAQLKRPVLQTAAAATLSRLRRLCRGAVCAARSRRAARNGGGTLSSSTTHVMRSCARNVSRRRVTRGGDMSRRREVGVKAEWRGVCLVNSCRDSEDVTRLVAVTESMARLVP